MTLHFMVAFSIAMLLSVVLTPFAKILAIKVGAVDKPNERKVHSKLMPRMGGVAIFGAYGLTYASIVHFTDYVSTNVGYAIFFGGLIVVIVGVIDDIFELPPKLKLLGQILAALVPIYFGLEINRITIPFLEDRIELGWLGIPITIFWILAITNAINLIDGLDGLAAGISSIAGLALFFVSLTIGNTMVAMMSIILVGSAVGFLFFNFHPAKIFMGDSGALFLGFALATLSLLQLKQATILSFLMPILMVGVPVWDTIYAMIRRKLNKMPISTADKNHLHHRLMSLGLSHRLTVIAIYFINFVFASMAVLLANQTDLWIIISVAVSYMLIIQILAEFFGMMQAKHRPILNMCRKIKGLMK